MKLSFIIPVKNETESVEKLVSEIIEILKKIKERSYEIIFIDDGSTDNTLEVIQKLISRNKKIKVVKHRGNLGKSIALTNGFDKAKGEIVFTMDGDLQDNPIEIPKFINKIRDGFDLVSGWKKTRHDPSFSKVFPSRIFNYLTRILTGVPIHDTNCGYKAYRREVVKDLNLYGELYRFIPIMAAKQHYKVTEIQVKHRPRKHGESKYGWGRLIKGLLDLITIVFITDFARRPGHFFGTLGCVSFLLGFLVGLYITFLRITTGTIQFRHPLLFLGMLLMIIGVQLVSTGLVAEMITYWQEKNKKTIS